MRHNNNKSIAFTLCMFSVDHDSRADPGFHATVFNQVAPLRLRIAFYIEM